MNKVKAGAVSVAVVALGIGLAPVAAAAAPAQTCDAYSGTCPSPAVLGEKVSKTPAVQGEVFTQPTSSSLPFTGADIAAMTVGGVIALGAGGGLLVVARRRRAPVTG